jgi:hypothetical protein
MRRRLLNAPNQNGSQMDQVKHRAVSIQPYQHLSQFFKTYLT